MRGSRMWEETGRGSSLALTHLYVQRAVLVKHARIVETQQHLIIARRQLPFGGEGRHISCRDNRSATLCQITPQCDAMFIWFLLTCSIDADGPVDLVISEKLNSKGTSVARSIGIHDIKVDG